MLKVGLLNWWDGGEEWLYASPYGRTVVKILGYDECIVDNETPDVVLVTGFGTTKPHKNVPHLYYQFENYRRPNRTNRWGIPEIGLIEDTDKSCHMGAWVSTFNILKNPKGPVFANRINKPCWMFYVDYPHRAAIIKEFNAVRASGPDKIGIISRYVYNIAVENSYFAPYVTEKANDAIMAGCIPIYEGGDLAKYTPYNLDRIIIPSRGDKLPRDVEAAADMWALPSLNPNADEMYQERMDMLKRFVIEKL